MIVEGCVESVEAAVAAEQGGADRLELCENLSVGGTTPSAWLVRAVKARVRIPVFTMIRPRGGSFAHSAPELDQMHRDIDALAQLGVDGIVLGILTEAGRIDEVRTRELVASARPLPVTFHRAFDVAADPMAALEMLVDVGVDRVLTGGGPGPALDGVARLRQLVDRAGDRLAIMAGGKVRADNVRAILAATGVREVHARCELDADRIRRIKASILELPASH